MSPDDLTREETERLMKHYDAPPPDRKFVDALGSRLQAELQTKRLGATDAQPIDRSNRVLAVMLAAIAASLLVLACGVGAAVWLVGSRLGLQQTAQEPVSPQRPASTAAPTPADRQLAGTTSSSKSEESATAASEDAAANRRPGTPVAEGLTGRPRVEPQADRGALATTPRYGWQRGKTYAYTFKIDAKIGEGHQQSSGRVTYQASDPAGQFQVSPATEQATGSAFVVTSAGHLVTCAHVVRGATRVDVQLNGQTHPATILALDKGHDLALIKIEAAGLAPLALGDSASVELAQDVRVVGYPLTDVLGSTIKITRGTVAGFVNQDNDRLFQVDAPINAGNSGGPVVNARGEVVGVASAKLSGEEISNVGFAVPVAEVRALLQHQSVSYQAAAAGHALEGPELARRVTPAVGLVEVTIGPGGYGVEQQTLLNYDASMTTREPSVRAAPRGRRVPPFGPPPELTMDPFSRMRASMPDTERGKFRVDVVGETYDDDLELNLPFLFGPVALLAIEPLGESGESVWYRQRTLSIIRTEQEEQASSPFGPFRHHPRFFGHPLAPEPDSREKVIGVTSAFERFDYELGALTEDTIEIKKRYSLKTLDDKADPKFTVKGEGAVLFDRQAGVPKSMQFDARFEVQTENVTLGIPVKFTYEQVDLTPAASAPAAPAAVAAQPTAQEQPKDRTLKAEQVDDILKRLGSNEHFAMTRALAELKNSTPGPRHKEIAQTLEGMLKHKDWPIRQQAAEALVVWCLPENEPALLAALHDSNFTVRGGAIRALATIPSATGAAGVVAVYADNAHEAKPALIKMGPVAEEAVLTLVDGEHWVHRSEACEILGQIGSSLSLARLREAATDSNGIVQMRAKSALAEVEKRVATQPKTPEEALVELRQKYAGPAPIDSSGKPVTGETNLQVGQILQVRDGGVWYPVDVQEVLPDGRVKIHYRGWQTTWDKVVARTELQLAHEGIEQPAQSTTTGAPPPAPRAAAAANSTTTSTPEDVLRAFLLALTMVDREQGLPHLLEGTDAEILWQAAPPPRLARPGIEQWLSSLAFRRLQIGDQIALPDGRQLVVSDRHVNDDKVMITWDENPVPFILVKTPSGWRVDARTISMARTAAQQAREKSADKAK